MKQITKRLVEAALEAEMEEHLGYPKGERGSNPKANPRNGTTPKRVRTDDGELELQVPRDRNGTFQPQIVKKRQTRLTGFDDKVLSLYGRGMSTREIQGAPGGTVLHRSLACTHFPGHGRRSGGRPSVAHPAAGSGLADRLPGRPGAPSSRGRDRAAQIGVPGHRGGRGGTQGGRSTHGCES